MHREIKFRYWDTTDKERKFGYVDFSSEYVGCIVIPAYGKLGERYIYQQSTGLKDKNGKEIYEGDVVKYIYNIDKRNGSWSYDTVGVISFDGMGFKFKGRGLEGFLCSLPGFSAIYNPNEFLEVVGNILENPKLLGNEV